jgi:hypothetical protein
MLFCCEDYEILAIFLRAEASNYYDEGLTINNGIA